MKDEKKLVLDLLDRGRITKEEALILLDGMDSDNINGKTERTSFEGGLKQIGKSIDGFAKKANEKYKEYEPQIQDATEKAKDLIVTKYNDISKKTGEAKKDAENIFEHDEFL